MPGQRPPLKYVIARLRAHYGAPKRPVATDPFEMILWENVAYLVDDERRAKVFRRLKREAGTRPEAILETPIPTLAEIIRAGGMRPPMRAEKLHRAADLALEVGLLRLRRLVRTAPAEAKKILKRFPGVGDPLADRILCFARGRPSLGPDSNALRVLVRLGFGRDDDNYGRKYRSAAEAVQPELPADFPWLIAAHQLLRRHGQELCKRAAPLCEACPLATRCRWYLERQPRSLRA